MFSSRPAQNLAEAEFSVALYMYMRLLGYPADRISILTTYNGQKHLIRDVINQRCGSNPFFGQPNKVSQQQLRQWNVFQVDGLVCTVCFLHVKIKRIK